MFEQILPKLNQGVYLFLEGISKRLSFTEELVTELHGLPKDDKSPNFNALIYPDITSEDAVQLRQHFGSLLFYGMYSYNEHVIEFILD